jgi:acyl-CoA thioesterase-1
MARRDDFGLSLALTCALTLHCGNDSSSSVPPSIGANTPEGTAEMMDANDAPGGAPATVPTGQAAPGEASNAGLDGAPIVEEGAGQPAGGGASGENAGQPAEAAGAGGVAAAGGSNATGVGGSASGTPIASPFPSGVTRPRIMIVGDSISAGPGCHKKYLLANLNANGYSNFDFVGEYTDDCGGGVMHGAVSCSTAEQYAQPTFTMPNCFQGTSFPGISALVTEHRPDLVMLQLGVNDVWNARPTDAILDSFATLVQQTRDQNPNVVIAIAQIQKIRPTSDANPDAVFARAEQLISALPAWAQTQSQPQSAVFVADLWTASDTTQTTDGVHPDDAGARRMGQSWFDALKSILTPD